jgi:uroporphyrinogen decarboxylase
MIFGDFADQRSLMVSPRTFREVLKPVLADLVSRLRAIRPDLVAILHSDGNLTDVLDDLIECGFDAVHPIQPESMDMYEVKRVFGDRLTLFGGVSVQSELPGCRPEDVRSLVRSRIDELGRDGGFMLAPTNTILSDCPIDSILAMYDEGRRGE